MSVSRMTHYIYIFAGQIRVFLSQRVRYDMVLLLKICFPWVRVRRGLRSHLSIRPSFIVMRQWRRKCSIVPGYSPHVLHSPNSAQIIRTPSSCSVQLPSALEFVLPCPLEGFPIELSSPFRLQINYESGLSSRTYLSLRHTKSFRILQIKCSQPFLNSVSAFILSSISKYQGIWRSQLPGLLNYCY